MFAEIAQKVRGLFPEATYIPYIRHIEHVPHDKDSFVSLYLLGSEVEYPKKRTTTYQVLFAKRNKGITDEVLNEFEALVYDKVEELYRSVPAVEISVEFGVSDAFLYAYIKLRVREGR
ncbi:hypothetical protein JCM9492_11090 [Aquifex pyrophilus]